jgi:hypothetical protein
VDEPAAPDPAPNHQQRKGREHRPISTIDKQRITAARVLQDIGFHFRHAAWVAPPHVDADLTPEADRLHALLVPDGSPEDTELKATTESPHTRQNFIIRRFLYPINVCARPLTRA